MAEINKWTPIFGIDRNEGKRLPTELVETFPDTPLVIVTGKDVNLSGSPFEVFSMICNLRAVGPLRFEYIEIFFNKTQLRKFSRKEVLQLLHAYFAKQPQQNRNYILMQL